jgi:hypothetical protein
LELDWKATPQGDSLSEPVSGSARSLGTYGPRKMTKRLGGWKEEKATGVALCLREFEFRR